MPERQASPPSSHARLGDLFAKVDAFFAKAHERHGDAITCHAGCDDCCRRRFSVTALEAAAIDELLATTPPETRATLATRARDGDPTVCPALDPDGRCAVYAARPLICRTHGLPIRFTFTAPTRPGTRSLPLIDACPKNFGGHDLAAIDPASVLDQTTLSTILAALDAAYAGDTGTARGERIEIADVLAR